MTIRIVSQNVICVTQISVIWIELHVHIQAYGLAIFVEDFTSNYASCLLIAEHQTSNILQVN